jgi:Sortase domain
MRSRRLVAALAAGCTIAGGSLAGVAIVLHFHRAPVVAVQQAASTPSSTPWPTDTPSPTAAATPDWTPGSPLPRTLQANLQLHSAYAAVPLRFEAPTLGIDAPVLGVGLTSDNAVDAPKGPASSPLWDDGFWYRGSAEPGQPGVFALAGHVDRVGGAAAAFANLHRIKVGDVVSVLDQRTHIAWQYRITETESFNMSQVGSSGVLDRIYGPDVAAGKPPAVPADMVARISIITCAGTWTGVQYDHRFVAFGELVGAANA